MNREFLIQLVFCKKKTMWFIGVEVEQETSAPPKKNPGSAPEYRGKTLSPVLTSLACTQTLFSLSFRSARSTDFERT